MNCKKCLQPIDPFQQPYVSLADNVYMHPHCFLCTHCLHPLSGNYITSALDGQPYHLHCYESVAPTCAGCNLIIKGIGESACVLGDGRRFHAACFICRHCLQPLQEQFMQHAETEGMYHLSCYDTVFGARCAHCHTIIPSNGAYMQYKSHCFHKHCFVCHSCSQSLVGQRFKADTLDSLVLTCETCFKSKLIGTRVTSVPSVFVPRELSVLSTDVPSTSVVPSSTISPAPSQPFPPSLPPAPVPPSPSLPSAPVPPAPSLPPAPVPPPPSLPPAPVPPPPSLPPAPVPPPLNPSVALTTHTKPHCPTTPSFPAAPPQISLQTPARRESAVPSNLLASIRGGISLRPTPFTRDASTPSFLNRSAASSSLGSRTGSLADLKAGLKSSSPAAGSLSMAHELRRRLDAQRSRSSLGEDEDDLHPTEGNDDEWD